MGESEREREMDCQQGEKRVRKQKRSDGESAGRLVMQVGQVALREMTSESGVAFRLRLAKMMMGAGEWSVAVVWMWDGADCR